MRLAVAIQDRQETREAKLLHNRYPCCGVASRHDLAVGDERDVACSRCGMAWTVTVVAGSERGAALAGRPVASAQWRRKGDGLADQGEAIEERAGSSAQSGA